MELLNITPEAIEDMNRLYRINLINSITGFKSANLIGTVDANKQTNLAVFSSVTHFGSNPPVIGMVMRPTVVPRHTYENIKSTGFYTINHIHQSIITEAHQTSAKYDTGTSEFEEVGLTPVFEDGFIAPYVEEAVIRIGMRFQEEVPIKLNDTILILGTIEQLILPAVLVKKDGWVDLHTAETVAISGLDTYSKPNPLARFDYARPAQATKKLEIEE